MPFDDTQKEQIRSRIDIASLIGRHVRLKQSGHTWKGLCPFHREKTPSFIVSPDRGTFHCFGCGKGGDIFTFVQEIEQVDFPEALQLLAEEAGVRIETRTPSPPSAPGGNGVVISKPEQMRVHRVALQYYYRQIKPNRQAVDWCISRGLQPQTIRAFGLGYAPRGWSNLIEHCRTQGIDAPVLEACGLALRRSPDTPPYDRFRDRIMFSLCDSGGRVVGFAGRGLAHDAKPKYLNSPETLLYRKSRILYGLHAARKAVQEENSLMIVEGYMDYLTLYQAGICNVAATSGTALTDEHGRIIHRFTRHVTLVFDGDEAGVNAAVRAVFSLGAHNLDVGVVLLDPEDDPDSFVRNRGADAFREQLRDHTVNGLAFVLEQFRKRHGFSTPQGISLTLDETLPYLQALSDEIVLRDAVRTVASTLAVDESIVTRRLNRRPSPARLPPSTPHQQPACNVAAYSATLEGNVLRILLQVPRLVEDARRFIDTETFTNPISKNIYSIITRGYSEDPSLETVLDYCGDNKTKAIVSGLIACEGPLEQAGEDLNHSMVALQRQFLKNRQRECTRMLRETDPAQGAKKALLLEQYQQITAQLNELNTG